MTMILYFNVSIILDFIITYINAAVLCQSECAVNMAVFFFKSNEITYRKGRALIQTYMGVSQTKRGKSSFEQR